MQWLRVAQRRGTGQERMLKDIKDPQTLSAFREASPRAGSTGRSHLASGISMALHGSQLTLSTALLFLSSPSNSILLQATDHALSSCTDLHDGPVSSLPSADLAASMEETTQHPFLFLMGEHPAFGGPAFSLHRLTSLPPLLLSPLGLGR